METPRPGILCIFNNIAPGSDEIFEHWFQHEHLAERLSVPGFLLGRRYEAISADRQFFNYYLTESAEVLSSDAYLARVNDPTALSKKIMSEIFRDMVRTVCERFHATGDVRGSAAVAVRSTDSRWTKGLCKSCFQNSRKIPRSVTGKSGGLWMQACPYQRKNACAAETPE